MKTFFSLLMGCFLGVFSTFLFILNFKSEEIFQTRFELEGGRLLEITNVAIKFRNTDKQSFINDLLCRVSLNEKKLSSLSKEKINMIESNSELKKLSEVYKSASNDVFKLYGKKKSYYESCSI